MNQLLLYYLLLLTSQVKHQNVEINRINTIVRDSLATAMKNKTVELLNYSQHVKSHHYLDSINAGAPDSINGNLFSSTYLRLKGLVYIHSGKPEISHKFITKAIEKASTVDSTNRYLSAAMLDMCNLWFKIRNWDSALVYGLKAYHISKKNGGSQLATICLFLHSIYSQTRDLKNYKKYLFEGLRYSKGKPEEIIYLSDVGSYYQQQNQTDSALHYMERFYTSETVSSPYIESAKNLNYGAVLSIHGEIKKGLYHLKKGISIRRTIAAPDENVYTSLALAYHKLGNIPSAALYYDTALSLCRNKFNYYQIAALNSQRAAIDKERNQPGTAYKWMDSALFYYAKFDSVSLAEKTIEIEMKYSVKDKIDSISKLTFENTLNTTIKKQQSVIIGSLSIGCLLLVGFGTAQYKRLKLKTAVKEFQLHQSALRSKMHPHFVFNSLSILQGLINFNEKEKAIGFLQVFSKYARINFEMGGRNAVKLTDEISALECYLRILSEHYSKPFSYEIKLYENYQHDHIYIIPMIIQPFVENSILHGFEGIDYNGFLSITIERMEKLIICTIEDNGKGANTRREHNLDRRGSSEISQNRLALQARKTGLKAGFKILDRMKLEGEKGTRVVVQIPFDPEAK